MRACVAVRLRHTHLHHLHKLHVAVAGERLIIDALKLLEVDVRVRKVQEVALLLVLEHGALALGGQVFGVGDHRVDLLVGRLACGKRGGGERWGEEVRGGRR